jgi:hypothetical protein
MTKKVFILAILVFCVSISSVYASEKNIEKSTTLQNNFPNIFRPIGDLVRRILGRKHKPKEDIPCQEVRSLVLNRAEILEADFNKSVEVFVKLEYENPMQDTIIYDYQISAGKIIGKGEKIVWDLTDVKVGTYTITAKVDNGCGLDFGKSMTKTITIKSS